MHFTEAGDGGLLGDLVELEVGRLAHGCWFRREAYIKQLLWVQASVPVCGSAEGGGDFSTCRVNSLEDSFQVNASSYFFDEDWGKSLCSQSCVDTQEVDLCRLNVDSIDLEVHRYARDHAIKFHLFASSDSKDPFWIATRGHDSPSDERDRVIEAEHFVLVSHIIFHQKVVNFLGNDIIVQVKITPIVLWWQDKRLCANLLNCLLNDGLVKLRLGQSSLFVCLWHRLTVPELVSDEDRNCLL